MLNGNDGLLASLRLLQAAFERAAPAHQAYEPLGPGIRDLRQRDPGAWRTLLMDETPAVYRYVRARVRSAEDAEDLTSEVLEEAWRCIGSLEDRGLPPRSWLFGIAARVVARHWRRHFRRPPALSIAAFDGTGGDPAGRTDSLDLVRGIAALKRQHAEVIVLRFLHGLSIHETASLLDASVDAIKGRQARALEELRRRLDTE